MRQNLTRPRADFNQNFYIFLQIKYQTFDLGLTFSRELPMRYSRWAPKMRRQQRTLISNLFYTLLLLSFQSCTAVNFASNASSPTAAPSINAGNSNIPPIVGGNCSLSNVRVPVNILFVVDRSGSNVEETQDGGLKVCDDPNSGICAPATDPKKSFRGDSINNFFKANQGNSLLKWGFIGFNGVSTDSYITDASTGTFGDAKAMQTAIDQFYAKDDEDGTPYLAALSEAKQIIAGDPGIKLSGIKAPIYQIIFLSDGHPTDAVNSDGSVDLVSINAAISDITSMAPHRIFMSTVYYGTINEAIAANTLSNMAGAGGGQFVNVDTGNISSISINNLITIPSGDCKPK